MSGHPNPFRDGKEVIPMDDKGLLEPSFAEAIAAIEQSLGAAAAAADALGLFAPPDRQGAGATA
jgi:hypothetical protein